jgi:phospholipase A-2-activating protein
VAFPSRNSVVSASRDATVRAWNITSSPPPKYDEVILSHGTAFVNAVTYLMPSAKYPEGLIVSGGKDTIIEVRHPKKTPEESAEALLLGHSSNVCALDVDSSGSYIVSGGWDGKARTWLVGKWECEVVFDGHEGSVWAVLAFDRETIITGCADKLIRVFHISGKLLRTIRGSTDVVRALCRIPEGHYSGADFASAGNDGIIRLWTISGRQAGQLQGHESFIYSLSSLPTGEIISSGEDRTIRVWNGNELIQTITLPAISVWAVAACAENGDIVAGTSDRMVRVFSRSSERYADAETIRLFEESIKSSSIPQQQVGDLNKEKLPGPDFLQKKAGTKEGQVQMIKEYDGSIAAHQWSSS